MIKLLEKRIRLELVTIQTTTNYHFANIVYLLNFNQETE